MATHKIPDIPFTGDWKTVTTDYEKRVKAAAEPSWASTTVDWLISRHSAYVSRPASVSAPERLKSALRKMSYGLAQIQANSPSGLVDELYESWLTTAVSEWSSVNHQALRDYLSKGGYNAERERLMGPRKSTRKKSISDAVVEVAEDEIQEKSSAPKEQTVDDAVAGLLQEQDDRFGAW